MPGPCCVCFICNYWPTKQPHSFASHDHCEAARDHEDARTVAAAVHEASEEAALIPESGQVVDGAAHQGHPLTIVRGPWDRVAGDAQEGDVATDDQVD